MLCDLIRIASSINIKRKINLNYHKSAIMRFFSKEVKNEFEIAVANEPLVFEPLKFYCIFKIVQKIFNTDLHYDEA